MYEHDDVLSRTTLNVLTESMLVFSPQGRVLTCNPAAEHFLGLPLSELKQWRLCWLNWQRILSEGMRRPQLSS
jgi:PAS domain-containing protein